MTTRRSSSHLGSQPTATVLIEVVDSAGESLLLEDLIGKGGEGSVFKVEGHPSLAAKIYHQTPISARDLKKLEAMISRRSPELVGIAAWPQSLLYSPHRKAACGIVVPRISDARHLHELYGTSNRRRHFAHAKWQHLVLAARNVAAAFDTVHEAGIVVGDVNQGNLLVDDNMTVRFIDCDSFQISADGETYLCPVGAAHFTPPELQNKKLRDTPRTVDHDRFGMAVLLFHLLFVGRHPFAGRYFGTGELSIEQAIAQRRFAFSRDKAETLMEPPPASLVLDDIPAPLAELFERAFRGPESGRPTAVEWVKELDLLIQQRKSCSFDPAHVYYSQLYQCPWCRIEDEGGPAFFVLDGSASIISPQRLDHLEAKLRRLTIPGFPSLSPEQLKIPQPLAPKRLATHEPISMTDVAAAALIASVVICLAAPLSPWALLAGALGCAASAAYLLLSKQSRARRERVDQLTAKLVEFQSRLHRRAQAITSIHRQRQSAFDEALTQLKAERDHYRAADTQLQDVLVIYRATQKNRFLANHLIQEHAAHIPGMKVSLASVLQSYGIESALDVDPVKLLGVPMLSPGLTLELTAWRDKIERQFVFKPEHGVSFEDQDVAGKAAVTRFKVAQARRILIGSRQLDSLAHAAAEQLSRELAMFEQAAAQGRDLVKDLRNAQSARRDWERSLNRSPAVVLAAALGGPILGLLLYGLFG